MKTLKNRILSGAMAGVLAMSLAVPAFAAGGTPAPAATNTTEINGTYTPITIDVVVPANGAAQINPYGLPIDVAKSDNSTKVSFENQKIMTQPTAAIKNKMKVDLAVKAAVTGAIKALPGGSTATPMKFASEALTADVTAKSVFAYVQVKPSAQTGADDATLGDALIDEYAAWEQDYDAAKDILVKVGTETKENFVTLKAAEMDTAANGGGFKAYKAGSVALIRVAGDVVASPREDWSTDDGFTVKIAYTFAPAPAAAP